MNGRREFLRRTLAGGAAVAGTAACPSAHARGNAEIPPEAIGLLFDSTLCIGCKACVAACKAANDLPLDYNSPVDALWDMPLDTTARTYNVIKAWQSGTGTQRSGDCPVAGRLDEGHVGQRHEPARRIGRGAHASRQAVAHAALGCGARKGFAVDVRKQAGQRVIVGSQHHDHPIAGLAQPRRCGQRHRLTVGKAVHQLVAAEAAPRTGGEQDADDLGAHARTRGSAAAAAVAGRVATPLRTAVISARIASAISGGVRLPIGRPTGPCRRSTCAGVRSKYCSRRSRRCWLFTVEPSAPT